MSFPLSGFTAIPNPYMVPFMGLQSFVIGTMFGLGFQGSKRNISSMSNDEFNAIKGDLPTFAMDEMRKMTTKSPTWDQMFAEMRPMVEIMARELGNLISSLPKLAGTVASSATGSPFFGSTALVGAPGGSPFTGGSSTDFDTYLKFLQGLKQPGQTFNAPAQSFNSNEQFAINAGITPNTLDKNAGTITWRSNITFKEVAFLLQLRADGKLFPSWKSLGTSLLKKYNSLKPVQKTPVQAIAESGLSGVNERIATAIANMRSLLSALRIYSKNKQQSSNNYRNVLNNFLATAKKHNQFVALNRKNSFAVDTAKSISALGLVFKT